MKEKGYDFYCKELFIVKHKSKYSCKGEIYFNLGSDIIKENCNFVCYLNITNRKPTILNCRNKNYSSKLGRQ